MKPVFGLLVLASVVLFAEAVSGSDWVIPLAGNSFRTAPAPSSDGLRRRGTIVWDDQQGVFSIFFRVDRAAELGLELVARNTDGHSTVVASVGDEVFKLSIDGQNFKPHRVGVVRASKPGYVRVDLAGLERTGPSFGEFRELLVSSKTDGLQLDYVRNNDGNMYYWGRRGPSVHLRYEVPREVALQYAYSEITVPAGQDPIGSFYMANGFGEGYFGMQVNGPDERRVLFSVWSPFKTDNPRDIPDDQRIVALGKGEGVRIGEFGNEGSGGQSFLVYPWKTATTYRFLTEVKPDGRGNTVYTAWFGEKGSGDWRLIASFRRPKTDTTLRGFHSFLESFDPALGYQQRGASYGNVWVGDARGRWHECTQARFSVDGTGRGRHRLDFLGGAQGSHFYLRNCGFFAETGRPGETLTRRSSAAEKPVIDPEQLPRSQP
jgi:hypothetical protein